MKKQLFWSLVPLLLAAAAPVAADDRAESRAVSVISSEELQSRGILTPRELLESLPKQQFGVHTFYQDVHALQPSSGPGSPVFSYGGSVIGLGADYTFRPNVSSGFYLRGIAGYGFGGEKIEVEQTGITFTDKVTFKALYGSAAGGIITPITKKTSVYGQAGLFYSTTKATFDDGTDEIDGEPFNVFGLDTAVGLRWNCGGKSGVFFEHYSQFGWGSGEDGDAKYNETVKYGCFRGGYAFGF